MASVDLVYNFLGLDRGAGASFDRMAGKTLGLSRASSTAEKALNRLVLGAGAAATVIGVASVKAAANYQTALTQLVTGAGETSKGLKTVHDQLLKMSGPMSETATDMAKAMYPIESAGFHAANGVRILRASIQGAKADGANIVTVADAVTTALNAYGLSSKRATAVTDAMVAAVAHGKTRMEDLAASLGNVLPIAAALNVPLQQVLGAMATMTFQGTDAARASQYLRFALSALANPTSKAQKELTALHLSTKSLSDAVAQKGLTGAFTMLQDAVGSQFPRGSAAYVAALSNIVGGTRGMQAVLELTGKHLQKFQANTDHVSAALKNAGGNVEGWGKYTSTFQYNLDSAKGALHSLEIQLGEKLLPTATHALNWLATKGVSDLKSFGQWIEHNKGLLEGLAGTLAGVALGIKGLHIAGNIASSYRNVFKGGSLLGGIASKTSPLPVYVTNWAGGKPSVGGAASTVEKDAAKAAEAGGAAATLKTVAKRVTVGLAEGLRRGITGAVIAGTADAVGKLVGGGPGHVIANLGKGTGLGYSVAGPPGAALGGAAVAGGYGVNAVAGAVANALAPADAMAKVIKQMTANGKGLQNLERLNQIAATQVRTAGSVSKTVQTEIDQLTKALTAAGVFAKHAGDNIGSNLGQGLVQAVEAQIPHATVAGKLLVDSTVKQMRLAAQVHSPSELTAYIGRMLAQGLAVGFVEESKHVGDAISRALQSTLDRMQNAVQNARTRLQGDLQARSQFVTQELSSAALTNVPTVASGYTGNTTRLSGIDAFLKGQAHSYAVFAKDLRRLAHHGLSKSLVSQIAAMGPTQGLQYAQQILANPSMIGSLDAYQKQILRSSRQIAGQQYDPQIREDRSNLRELVREQKSTNRLLERIANHPERGGTVNITINGRQEKITQHEAREIEIALAKLRRRMGKG